MHPRNKIRLLAGIKIDPTLEITESHVDKDKDKKVKDKEGKKYEIKSSGKGEGSEENYKLKDKEGKETTKKAKELIDEQNEPSGPTPSFRKGDVVMFDNGVWIVHITDPQANKIGLIPPGLKGAEEEECSKSMQMVDPGKVRKHSSAEKDILPGPDGILGTADDIHLESTLNFTPSNAISYANTKSNAVNSIPSKKINSDITIDSDLVKSEIPTQLDQRGDLSEDDYANNVKVPSKLKTALRDAITEYENEVKKMEGRSAGATIHETAILYANTAAAFKTILDYLEEGTIQSVKQAQLFASSLMGPLFHKLPDGVWDFIVNGGQKRSLQSYVNKIRELV